MKKNKTKWNLNNTILNNKNLIKILKILKSNNKKLKYKDNNTMKNYIINKLGLNLLMINKINNYYFNKIKN